MRRKTGVKDSNGTMIHSGDIISVIHQSDEGPEKKVCPRWREREFRYKVEWNESVAAFVLTNKHTNPFYVNYLGEMHRDPNLIRVNVLGRKERFLEIYQGYPPGYTDEEYKKDFPATKLVTH